MKFFIPLDFRYGGTGRDGYHHVGSVYGPYEDGTAVDEALARLWPNDKKNQFLVFDGQIVNVKPSPKEKPESEKREPGDLENYVKVDDSYQCKTCKGTILDAKVAHPIHIRGLGGAGTGECRYEQVPYCPNCEKKPNIHGTPVYVNA